MTHQDNGFYARFNKNKAALYLLRWKDVRNTLFKKNKVLCINTKLPFVEEESRKIPIYLAENA